jgi:ABC-type sugar transport system substrate-binding protein
MNEKQRGLSGGQDPSAPSTINTMLDTVVNRRTVLRASAFAGVSSFLAACGLETPSGNPAASSGSGPDTSNEEYVMVSVVATHPFWNDFQLGGQDAAKDLNVKFSYVGPAGFDVPAQVDAFEQTIAKKPAGIMAVHSTEALFPSVQKALDQGIPVLYVAGDGAGAPRLGYVGTNDYQVGVLMGQTAVKMLGGSGKVALSTVPAQDNLTQRINGINDVFAESPGMEIVDTADNKGDDSQTATSAAAVIQANPDLGAILCINATGTGIAAALKQTNTVGKVKAIVSDTFEPILDAIDEGTIQYTIGQKVYLEAYLATYLLKMWRHPPAYLAKWKDAGLNIFPSNVDTGVTLVDKSNSAVFRSAGAPS